MAIGTLGAITGGLGALGGIASGLRGDQSTSQSFIPSATEEEQRLQKQSIEQYLKQLEEMDRQDQSVQSLDPLRQQALQGYGDILSGQAFGITPQEQSSIENIRQQQINLGSQDLERMLQERINQVNQSAGVRNLRGQALGELQGQNVEATARELGNIVNTAGLQAAQSAQALPYQRIQAQSPFLQQGLSYQDQLRQQAVQNRSLAQSPAQLERLMQERLAQGGQTNQTAGGGLGGAIGGALGGLSGGFRLGEAAQGLSQGSGLNYNQGNSFAGTQGSQSLANSLRARIPA